MKAQKIIGVLLGIMLGLSAVLAQVHIQNFGIAQGLPQTQVTCLAEDSLSYLWVGTLAGGLARFDGSTFTTYNMADGLPNNFILDLMVLSPTKVWVATKKGISFFDGKHFKNFDLGLDGRLNAIRLFNNKDSVFYVLSDRTVGLILKDSIHGEVKNNRYKNLKKILKANDSSTILFQSDGEHNRILILRDGHDFAYVLQGEFNSLYSIFNFGDQTALSTDGGIFLITKESLVKLCDIKIPVVGYNVRHDKFIGSKGLNLVHVSRQDHTVSELYSLNSPIRTSYVDMEGTVWVGSNKGLFQIYPNIFENELTDPERTDPVMAIAMDDNKLIVGTAIQGVKVYQGNTLVDKYNFGSPRRNFVTFLRKDHEGLLWVGTGGGLAFYRNGGFHWMDTDKIPNAIHIDFDVNNNFVVGGESGLYKGSHTGSIEVYPELASTIVLAVKYNKSKDFFALGTNVGLKILSGEVVEDIDIPELSNVEISVLDWYNDETLMIGTPGKGVFIYSFVSHSIKNIINEEGGLNSNTLFLLFKDGDGFWAGTERGINWIQYDGFTNKVKGIIHYGAPEGLMGLETNLNAYFKNDSLLLFGAVDGLYTFKGNRQRNSKGRIHLTDLKLFYNQLPKVPEQFVSSTNYGDHIYSFSHTENHLTFSFNKVDMRNPHLYFYKYKLDGYDELWSSPTATKSATYSNLPPGLYTLMIAATDKSGSFIFDQTTLRFRIVPAFYQTAYFKIALIALVIGIILISIYYFNRIKIQRALYIQEIKEQEKTRLRKEIARDFHDELGNQVARMINYISLLRIRGNLGSEIYTTLDEFSQRIITGAKDFVWTLDSSNDELGNVVIHLKDFGERLFSEKEIKFRFYGSLSKPVKIPIGFSRQINLIFKEAMTNAFKHSQASEIDFSVRINDCEIIITLHDNGIGITQTDIDDAQRGLSNIKVRATRIGGKIKIQSNGTGTILDLILPV